MIIILEILTIFFHFVGSVLDTTIIFILVRLLLLWRRMGWLECLNKIGKSLVDTSTMKVNCLWSMTSHKRLSDRGRLLVGLMALSVARILVWRLAVLL